MAKTMNTAALEHDSARLWAENWHLLAHRSELAETHEFVRFDIAGRDVVLYNDGASVIAFDNRCPHRGARIYDGDSGKERFLCRYHGWSYSKGKVFVADRESLVHCPLDRLTLNSLQVEWLGDFAFVSPAPSQSLDSQLAGLEEMLEAVSRGIGLRWDFNRYLYEADWRIALENALEPYHLASIHSGTLDTLKLQPGTNRYFGRNSVWSAPLGDERMARRLNSLSRLFDLPHQFAGYESIYLFPFTMISSTFGYSQSLQHFLPAPAAERTHFTSRLFAGRLAAATKPELVSSFIASSAQMNRAVFEEDHEICKRVALDTWSMEPPRFWAASEEKLLHFRRSYREAVSPS
jgi:phenylpropionate dioxygenase-like ring-hydroxylating dioxygenase large terminal subunit